jgi:hypothetical protein
VSRRGRALAVASLLALAAGCSWQGAASERDTVTLRFEWPVGTRAVVETEHSTRTTGPHGPRSTTARLFYRIEVEKVEDGRLIRHGDIRAQDPRDGRIHRLEELPESVASQLEVFSPSYVVSDEGRLVRLERSGALIEEARRKLERRAERLAPGSREARELAAASLSEERLLAGVREHWEPLVGAWAGTDLVVGETYRRAERLLLPRPPVRVRSTAEYSLQRRIPCNEETTSADCVEIEVRSRPLPEALDQLERAMRAGARAEGVDAPENLEIEGSSYLVTEPSTLLPHYLETTTKFRATLPRSGGSDVAIEDLDQTIYRFRYR